MPDLFNYWLTGRTCCEFSIATTTQCYDPRERDWAVPLLERLDISPHIFPEVVPPGTILGDLLPSVADEVGARALPVIAPACHDTGSAVAAVPAADSDFAYISSGTWSLMGAELAEPAIDEKSLAYDFTNEGGVGGTFRFLKNITGLWLVQECRRTWTRRGDPLSYDDLTHMAAQAEPLRSLVDPDWADFLKPGDMPARIREFCRMTGQPVPESKGAVVRCALESLALEYRWIAERLDEIVGRPLPTLHIFGGGSKNRLLNQFAADATGRTVVAGPVEATAIGNILVQAIALGHVADLAEARALVRRSFEVEAFGPCNTEAWEEASARYLRLRRVGK